MKPLYLLVLLVGCAMAQTRDTTNCYTYAGKCGTTSVCDNGDSITISGFCDFHGTVVSPAPAPEPFDVGAVRKPRNEEYAKVCADNKLVQGQYPTIYKTLCSEDAIAPWTCADHRRTLLTSEDGKHHCFAFWMVKP